MTLAGRFTRGAMMLVVLWAGIGAASAQSIDETLGAVCNADWSELERTLQETKPGRNVSDYLKQWLRAHAQLGLYQYEDALRSFVEVGKSKDETSSLNEWVNRAEQQNCKTSSLLALMADASVRLGEPARAQRFVTAAIQMGAFSAVTLDVLGMVTARNGDVEQALNYFMSASAIDPDYLNSQVNVVIALLTLGANDMSPSAYDALAYWGNEYSSALNTRAVVSSVGGNYVNAENDLVLAVSRLPQLKVSEKNLEAVRWFKAEKDLELTIVSDNLDRGSTFLLQQDPPSSRPNLRPPQVAVPPDLRDRLGLQGAIHTRSDVMAAYQSKIAQTAITSYATTLNSQENLAHQQYWQTVKVWAVGLHEGFKAVDNMATAATLMPITPPFVKVWTGSTALGAKVLGRLSETVANVADDRANQYKNSIDQGLQATVKGRTDVIELTRGIETWEQRPGNGSSVLRNNFPTNQTSFGGACSYCSADRGGVKMTVTIVRPAAADFTALLGGKTSEPVATSYNLEVPYVLYAQ